MSLPASGVAASKLEPFLLLARNAKGAAAAKLIQQATAAPGCYVFSELLEKPGIQELQSSDDHAASYRLLELFAYGALRDYTANTSSFPTLDPAQLTKLKQLTLVSACSRSRTVAYKELLQELDISEARELEDFIIESVYAGILTGRLDQKEQTFQVEGCLGRDVRDKQELSALLQHLQEWSDSTDQALALLAQTIDQVKNSSDSAKTKKQIESDALAAALTRVADKLANDSSSSHTRQSQFAGMHGGPGGRASFMPDLTWGAGGPHGGDFDGDSPSYSGGPQRNKKKIPMSPSGRSKRTRA